MTNDVVIGINCYVAAWLVITKDVVVAVAEGLASAELYINVTKDVLVTIL